APITGYSTEITGFTLEMTRLCAPAGSRRTAPGTLQRIPASFRADFAAKYQVPSFWIQPDGTWYFAADSGELQGGLLKINGNVYYMDSNSLKLQTGDRTVNGETHTFTENGTTDG